MSILSLIKKLDVSLFKRYPHVHEGLAPKASAAMLKKVPRQLVPLYRWHNGSESEIYGDYFLLSINGAVDQGKKMDATLAKNQAWKKSGWWSKKWLPFLDDHGGNLLCFDFEGVFGGAPGQIIHFDHETGPEVAFASVERLIETLVGLIAKEVLLAEDNGVFEQLYAKNNPGFPHRGSPKLRKLKDDIAALYNDGEYSKMLARVARALKLAPLDAELFNKRGICLWMLDRHEEALDAFEREIEIADPQNPPGYRAYRWKAECLLELDLTDDAAKTLVTWIKRIEALPDGPDNNDLAAACRLLGDVHRWGGRLSTARKIYEKGLAAIDKENKAGSITEFDYDYWTQYIRCLKGAGRTAALKKSRREVEKLARSEPDNAAPYYYLAYFCMELGSKKSTLDHLERAVALQPEYREEAKEDEDFQALWENPRFISIVSGRTASPEEVAGAGWAKIGKPLTEAQQRLHDLRIDDGFIFTGDPKRDAKIADALRDAGGDIPRRWLKHLMKGFAEHHPNIVVRALACGSPAAVVRAGCLALGSSTLAGRFLKASAKHDAVEEAAGLLRDFSLCAHAPGLIKHLKKRGSANQTIIACAQDALRGKKLAEWAEGEFFSFWGLVGILQQDAGDKSLKATKAARASVLRAQHDEDELVGLEALFDRVAKDLGG